MDTLAVVHRKTRRGGSISAFVSTQADLEREIMIAYRQRQPATAYRLDKHGRSTSDCGIGWVWKDTSNRPAWNWCIDTDALS